MNDNIPEFKINEKTPAFMVIKIGHENKNGTDDLYQEVRGIWRVDPEKANNYPYVLAVQDQIVLEVYKVDGWERCDKTTESGLSRSEFTGSVAPDDIRDLFIAKKLPSEYCEKGAANPVQYSKHST